VAKRRKEIEASFRQAGIGGFFVSAEEGPGIKELMAAVAKMLEKLEKSRAAIKTEPSKIFRPEPRDRRSRVRQEDGVFIIQVPELERIMAMKGVTDDELRAQLKHLLSRAGVVRELEKAGIKPGDRVKCGTLEWQW